MLNRPLWSRGSIACWDLYSLWVASSHSRGERGVWALGEDSAGSHMQPRCWRWSEGMDASALQMPGAGPTPKGLLIPSKAWQYTEEEGCRSVGHWLHILLGSRGPVGGEDPVLPLVPQCVSRAVRIPPTQRTHALGTKLLALVPHGKIMPATPSPLGTSLSIMAPALCAGEGAWAAAPKPCRLQLLPEGLPALQRAEYPGSLHCQSDASPALASEWRGACG